MVLQSVKNERVCSWFQEQLEQLQHSAPNMDPAQMSQLLSCCYSLLSPESSLLGLPDFPVDGLPVAVKLMVSDPESLFLIHNNYHLLLTTPCDFVSSQQLQNCC
jgi:hypothetical protein